MCACVRLCHCVSSCTHSGLVVCTFPLFTALYFFSAVYFTFLENVFSVPCAHFLPYSFSSQRWTSLFHQYLNFNDTTLLTALYSVSCGLVLCNTAYSLTNASEHTHRFKQKERQMCATINFLPFLTFFTGGRMEANIMRNLATFDWYIPSLFFQSWSKGVWSLCCLQHVEQHLNAGSLLPRAMYSSTRLISL